MILSVAEAIEDDELGLVETFATLLRNHSGPNLIDSVIVSSKTRSEMRLVSLYAILSLLLDTHLVQF